MNTASTLDMVNGKEEERVFSATCTRKTVMLEHTPANVVSTIRTVGKTCFRLHPRIAVLALGGFVVRMVVQPLAVVILGLIETNSAPLSFGCTGTLLATDTERFHVPV